MWELRDPTAPPHGSHQHLTPLVLGFHTLHSLPQNLQRPPFGGAHARTELSGHAPPGFYTRREPTAALGPAGCSQHLARSAEPPRSPHPTPPPMLLPHGISSGSPRPRLAQPHAFRAATRRPVKPILQQDHGPKGMRCCGSTARCWPQPPGSAGHCLTATVLCSVLGSIKAFLGVKTSRGRATAEAAAGLDAAETSR